MNGRPWTIEDSAFLKANWRDKGAAWCAGALGRHTAFVYTKAVQLGLHQLKLQRKQEVLLTPVVSPKKHSTLYSTAQLDALDLIGGAYTDRRIDFGTATELRDLVRAKRIDEALASLEASGRRAV